jgi:hypothetical protein
MSDQNLLRMIPERIATEIESKDGNVRVEFPRFKTVFGRTFGQLFGASLTIKLTLDEKSSAVWNLIDGWANVQAISVKMQKQFGEDIEPVYERLGSLLKILEANKLIRLRDEW